MIRAKMASTVGGVGLLLLSSNRSHFASRVKECLLSAKGRITTPGQKLYVCVLRDKDVPLGVTSGSIPLVIGGALGFGGIILKDKIDCGGIF